MGALLCANSVDSVVKDDDLIIDVEKVLADAAWRSFLIAHGK
jgi:hypothetical protein